MTSIVIPASSMLVPSRSANCFASMAYLQMDESVFLLLESASFARQMTSRRFTYFAYVPKTRDTRDTYFTHAQDALYQQVLMQLMSVSASRRISLSAGIWVSAWRCSGVK